MYTFLEIPDRRSPRRRKYGAAKSFLFGPREGGGVRDANLASRKNALALSFLHRKVLEHN